MAKLWGVEFVAEDIKQLGQLLNSRIGLALIQICLITLVLYFVYPRLEEISRNTYLTANNLQETKRVAESNHEILTRLIDRCEISDPSQDRRDRTASRTQAVKKITE